MALFPFSQKGKWCSEVSFGIVPSFVCFVPSVFQISLNLEKKVTDNIIYIYTVCNAIKYNSPA